MTSPQTAGPPSAPARRHQPDWFISDLSSCAVMAVFRGLSPRESVALAEHAWDLGVKAVEVPIESPAAIVSLEAVVAAGVDRGQRVGAGTIVSAEHLRAAIEAGAAYAVSPGLDPAVIGLADRASLPLLPGVATASEIIRARNLGFEWLKAFPASVLGTSWFSAMKGPFPTVSFVATGGMTDLNAAAFLTAGASVVGVGSAFGSAAQREALAVVISASRA